jgi:hypothetical protein
MIYELFDSPTVSLYHHVVCVIRRRRRLLAEHV